MSKIVDVHQFNSGHPLLYHQISLPTTLQLEKLKRFIAKKDYSVILESSAEISRQSRYCIVSFEPIIRVTVVDQQLHCEGYKLKQANHTKPFAAIKEILQHFNTKSNSNLLFNGGFLGYFGYDLSRNLESLPTLAKKDIKLPEMYMGFYAVAIVFDLELRQLMITGIPGYQRQADELLRLCQMDLDHEESQFQLLSSWKSNMTEQNYAVKFSKIKQYILAGDCYQINLAQRWQARYEGDPYTAYVALREANKAPYSAYINTVEHRILSISPEQFLSASEGKCKTRPIKGTRPRQTDPSKDLQMANELQQSSKDRSENVMIVDLLRNDLSKVCKINSVKVPALCQIESFAAVHHLVSTVTGELENASDNTDLLKACFPGGSITGAPKIRAMEIIEELEPHRRTIYCGAIGYLACNGNMDTSITIRTLVCDQQQIYCWAGGGIVVDSEVKQEYQETFHKVAKILPVLDIQTSLKQNFEE